jgi:hypothetical protein
LSDLFSPELRQFVTQHIESLAQLEALLQLQREPSREWDCAELSRALYITDDMCQGLVADLERRRLVARSGDGKFRYESSNPGVDRQLAELGRLYRERRVAVITEIYSRPVKRVQTFADSFRLRREE